jgi:bacterioferritin
MLQADLKLELMSQQTVKEGVAACETVGDYVSRDIFKDILEDTEEHIEWLETQLELIDRVGLPNYEQSQM